ncbi:aminoglycoside phosphotransferase (APT) family kinase protein [Nocardioides marinisabuli]|uniref:Aminoglycoside phosphotransferase (APT) family kinase protein n=1 Tax=Nocardioides marinisabuli TaxID=419476 RepID=A0A7Y9JRH1_9ACTN|nr:aminoglycoside phosphotransferase family protein [Nocardioides marinisabuli]NYD59212.1 aminoglycoside phosphotransferase (APT) family kinase protein [Nocardioides marinisabuli]
MDGGPALDWAARRTSQVTGSRELVGGWTSTMLALSTQSHRDVVLRLMDREPWRSHGAGLTTRESEVQQALVGSAVPAPRSLALDADGAACGVPAHLMTLVPGAVDVDRVDDESLDELARVLAAVHDVPPLPGLRAYESWAWEAKHVVPAWACDRGVWEGAFDLLRTEPPAHEPRLVHRDFHHRNVLWSRGRVTGVVDWVETSVGPVWLDVAHCCTNIAVRHGSDRADAFAAAYVARTGAEPQPYFDVMDVVGFLPPPGRSAWVTAHDECQRLEQHLRRVLRRATG